jgi:membrane associated rhomboid family serine protease
MLFPIRDDNPRFRFPAVTVLLIVANVAAFLFELSLNVRGQNALLAGAGAIPYEIINRVDIGERNLLPWPGSLWTSMFLHAGWLHLLGNMWFLWVFGDNVEERLGSFRFLVFYLVTGTVGALAQCFSMPDSIKPMIGASGAVAGVLGGYLMLYPHARIVTWIILFFWIRLPAWFFLGVWFIGQFMLPTGSGVAWMAHVGGFLGGLGLVRLLANPPPTPDQIASLSPRRQHGQW